MEQLLWLDIVTPEGGIFSDKVRSVVLPGQEGEFGVLFGHSDTLTLLSAGVIEIHKEDGKKELVAVNSGYVKVNKEKVDVLADGAVAICGDGDSKTAHALGEAKALLEKAKSDKFTSASIMSRIENTVKSM